MISDLTACPTTGDTRVPPASTWMRIITLVAVLLPIVGLGAAVCLLWGAPFHGTYLAVLGAMYLVTVLGIGVGFHRLFTHRSFETGPVLRSLWAVCGSMAVEGPLIRWVAVHRKHHHLTDVPGDPHSPHAHAVDGRSGVRALLKGIWHAHIGWMFEGFSPDLPRYVPDLLNDPVVRFVDRTFAVWVIVGLVIPAIAGGLLAGSWWGVLLGFLWGGLVRVLLVHHVTWSINSVCHLWGSRPFETKDESRDNFILGVIALGEGWHNTHHAFPASARHGLAWWKLDVNYLVIRAMQFMHLARNIRLPHPARVSAKRTRRLGERLSTPGDDAAWIIDK